MAKYLITGGCGFIGSTLAHALVSMGHEVCIIDDLSTGKKENAPREAKLILGSILDKKILKKGLEGIDGCFHLAAVVSIQETIQKWLGSHFINQSGTINILETMIEMKLKVPFVFSSTAAVYGHSPSLPISESTLIQPLSPYGVDKVGSENHIYLASLFHGIPVTIFRLFNVYGPKQDPSSPYSGVISIFMKKILSDHPITINGTGEQVRDFIHVNDVIRFFISAIQHKSAGFSHFNLCTGIGTSINRLVGVIENLTQKKVKKTYARARSGETLLSVGDPSKANSYFGMQAKYSLQTGLSTLIENLYRIS